MRVRLIPQREPSVVGTEDPQVRDLVRVIRQSGGAGLLEAGLKHRAVSALDHAGADRQPQFQRAGIVQTFQAIVPVAQPVAHGLTFPVVLQQQWEISRRYAMFATPIGYLIDKAGVITHDTAVGEDAILNFLPKRELPRQSAIATQNEIRKTSAN